MKTRRETDVLIIGGGIAGASTAYHLAQSGVDVALSERGEIACEASGVNAGSIGAIGWGNVPDLQSHLTMGSLQIFKSLQLDMAFDVEFRQSGSLQAIQTPEEYDFIRDNVLRLRSEGYGIELLTNREARAIEPALSPDVLAFAHLPLRAQADPVKATRAFASAAQRVGAAVLTNREVTSLDEAEDGSYRVQTGEGELRAGALVIAAGAWCEPVGRMLGLRIPVIPVRGQMWATGSVPPSLFHTISGAESELRWHDETGRECAAPPELTHRNGTRVARHLYGRQTRDGQIVFGGDRQSVGFDRATDAEGIEVNRNHASEVLPFLRELPIERTWAGLMPFSPDGMPIIGRIPLRKNLYVVTGLASSGFGRGPMAGKLLADYIDTGHMPLPLTDADPGRCVTEAD